MNSPAKYVMARGISGRPTTQHAAVGNYSTLCGRSMEGWSRSYQRSRIEVVFCLKCARLMGINIPHWTRSV